VGRMNYAWHVNHAKLYFTSASGPPSYLEHPMTLLHARPDVFGFREQLALTYPLRSDMQYWYAGAPATISPRNQFRAIGRNLTVLFGDVHIMPLSGLIAAALIFLLMGPNGPRRFKNILRSWPLFVPGVVAPCLYLLVSLEPRYVAPFLVLVLLGFFPGILFVNAKETAKRIVIPTLVTATFLMALTALLVGYHSAGFPRGENGELFAEAGRSLNSVGVLP